MSDIVPVEQSTLFPEWERDLLSIDLPETRKRYTAESLERNVAKRDVIVRALAEGHGLLRIAKAFAVSHHLVSALRDSRPELVAIEKKALSQQLGLLAKMTADSLIERLQEGKWKPGSVDLAILVDKKAQVDGDPGLIVEHRHTVEASPEGFLARLRAAVDSPSLGNPTKPQQIQDVEAIDVTPEPDSAVPAVLVPALAARPLAGGPGPSPGGGDAPAATVRRDPMHPESAVKSQKPLL